MDYTLVTPEIPQAQESRIYGTGLNPYCSRVWAALRKEFPTRVELKSLKEDPLHETEDPAAYIHKLRKN